MATRKAKGTGSIRKVTKERNGKTYQYWEATLTIGTDPGTGKQKRKTFSGKTQREVKEKLLQAAAAVDEGTFFEASKMTVKEWFETWLSAYMAAVKPLTVQQYRSMAETHIYPALGAVPLSKLSAPQLQKFYNQLAVDGKTVRRKNSRTGKTEISKEPLSAKTIQNIHAIISKALNVAIDQGMIKSNVAERVTTPRVFQEEVQPLTEEQQKAFLRAIKGHKYEKLYTVILFTGLREGEAVGLSWDCIDWKKGTLKVYRQLQRNPEMWSEFRYVTLKNNKARYIKLSPFVLSVLRDQKIKQNLERFAASELWEGFQTEKERETYFIFTDKSGKHLNPAPVYENFKKIAAQIGAPKARIHDLRHTFAVNSLQCGDDVKTVQSNLGHATAAFTLDRYAHVSERMAEESARRQQEYIQTLIG